MIVSKPNTKEYDENYDRIFRKVAIQFEGSFGAIEIISDRKPVLSQEVWSNFFKKKFIESQEPLEGGEKGYIYPPCEGPIGQRIGGYVSVNDPKASIK